MFDIDRSSNLFDVCIQEEGQHRTSILLGTWNRAKHIEWLNANPKKKLSSNVHDRQYNGYDIHSSNVFIHVFCRSRFISLYYTDGDMCALTKTRRVIEVKLR
jgi:hypothetical protein